MELQLITPSGNEINFIIDDWAPIEVMGEDRTEVALILIDIVQAKILRATLEYNSIKVTVGTDYLLMLDKPVEFRLNPKEDTLYLKYN